MTRVDQSMGSFLQADARAGTASREAAAGEKFEAYMVEMMVREMRKTVPDGIFSSSAMETFMDMLDQQIAAQIAHSGGLGLSAAALGGEGTHGGPPRVAHLPRPAYIEAPEPSAGRVADGRLPVAGGRITSRFGKRTDPFHKHEQRQHRGLDIAAPQGTPVHPIRPGRVVFAGPRGGLGNAVIVDHGGGMRSVYGHCHELKVKEGDSVSLGSIISTVGSTGRSTGPHLHLEVHQDGQAINPEEVLGQ